MSVTFAVKKVISRGVLQAEKKNKKGLNRLIISIANILVIIGKRIIK